MNLVDARAALNAGADLRDVLRRVWHLLEGGDAHAMAGYKVDRVTSSAWDDPVATIELERHGDPAGQVQTWRVDLAQGTAECIKELSLTPPVVDWDERTVAAELARLMKDGVDDPRLRWERDRRHVKLLTSKVHPPGTRVTTAQSRRLREALAEELRAGWRREHGVWAKTD